jgi:hypothetical protein
MDFFFDCQFSWKFEMDPVASRKIDFLENQSLLMENTNDDNFQRIFMEIVEISDKKTPSSII